MKLYGKELKYLRMTTQTKIMFMKKLGED